MQATAMSPPAANTIGGPVAILGVPLLAWRSDALLAVSAGELSGDYGEQEYVGIDAEAVKDRERYGEPRWNYVEGRRGHFMWYAAVSHRAGELHHEASASAVWTLGL